MVGQLDSAIELHITKLLASLAEYKASDLHLSAGTPPTLRVAGKLVPLTAEDMLTPQFIESVMAALLPAELQPDFALHREITFTHTFKTKARYKVHAYYQQGYISLSFRLIPTAIPPLPMLDIPEPAKAIIQYQTGLIVVAGAYGSGKSTVLASCIEYYNQTFAKHIVTFEQPIEIVFTDAKSVIEQRQIGRDIPTPSAIQDFAVREDVDIVMIADVETKAALQAAVHTAQMGKLVLIEITAESVQYALQRMIDMVDVTDEMHLRSALITSLRAIVALQAIPNNAGGVSLAVEVLVNSPGVVTMLRQDSFDKVNTILENGVTEGMVSFQQSINTLIQNGQISSRL